MTFRIEKITDENWFPSTNKNLFPHEHFVNMLFFHNYLTYSELITSYEQIDNNEFRDYIKQLPNIFKNNKCLLFKNNLPELYSDFADEFIFFRPNGYVKSKEKKSPLLKMEIYVGMNIMEEMTTDFNIKTFRKYIGAINKLQ